MIKFTILARRNPQLTEQEFLEHHKRHSALFATLPEQVKSHIRRYTLSHPAEEQVPGLPESGFDGVVELCFDDMGALMAVLNSKEYQTTILPDEERLLDLARCLFFLGNETEVIA